MSRRTWRWRQLALLAAVMPAGCTHDGPFVPGVYSPGVAPGAGSLVQLTYNAGVDLAPTWLPDGSGFFYTNERFDRPDRDRCLALLPALGGTIATSELQQLLGGSGVGAIPEPGSFALMIGIFSGLLWLFRPRRRWALIRVRRHM